MSCDSCKAALASDWLAFFSSMARTKKMPRMGEGRKPLQVRTRAEVHVPPDEPPALVEPPVPEVEAPPTLHEMERRRAEVEKFREVARCITDPTIGPDGSGSWAIYVGQGGASQEEALTDCGRQGSLEGIPLGWKSEKIPEVPARDGGCQQDPPVSEKYKPPYL